MDHFGMSSYSASTIAAIATPPGTGAVALIRVSGPRAAEAVGTVFQGRDRSDWRAREQHFGKIVDEQGEVIDEVLMTFFRGPASFTGEDVVEIATHGGVVVTNRVLRRILSQGVDPALPGEFSQRAFLNGRMDLTQAEAIMDLISAQTELAAKAATEQLSGRLGDALQKIREELISLTAHVEAYIDFPEEDIDPESSDALRTRAASIGASIDQLLATADQGRILREGLRTVICGAPNAGKSSLLNVLLGFERAIVNEAAGTTRDTIEEVVNLNGIPIRLIDTAGIRENPGAIEKEGIERSRQQMAIAELILFVTDGSKSREEALAVEPPEGARMLRILNKSDLPLHPDWKGEEGIRFSCHAPDAADLIREKVFQYITEEQGMDTANLTAINGRHQACLLRAREALNQAKALLEQGESPEFIAMDLRQCLESIGDVIGKTDIEEILGEIFSAFCIGK